MTISKVAVEFVDRIPGTLEDGKLYISIKYGITVHRCCCGCGHKVVAPLSPAEWKFTFDGSTVSLFPSIGNWGYPCRSHYWIHRNEVIWAQDMSDREIAALRRANADRIQRYTNPDQDQPRQRASFSYAKIWNRVRGWILSKITGDRVDR